MREDRAQSRQGAEDMQINMLRFRTLLSFITQNFASLRLCARPCLTGELQKAPLMRKCRAQSRQGAEEMQLYCAVVCLDFTELWTKEIP